MRHISKSLQQRLFTIYIAVRIASSAYSGIPQLSQLLTSQTRSKILRLGVEIFRIAPGSNYSKQIDIVPIVNISVRFVHQIIK